MKRALWILAAVLLFAFPARASISVIQHGSAHCSGNPSSCTITLSSNIGAGHLMVVGVNLYNVSGAYPTATMADAATSAYGAVSAIIDTTQGFGLQTFYTCSTGGAGGNTVTVSVTNTNAEHLMLVAEEVSGVATTGCLHQHISNFYSIGLTSFTIDSGYASTNTVPNSILIGTIALWDGSPWTGTPGDGQGGNYTQRSSVSWVGLEDEIVSSALAYKATAVVTDIRGAAIEFSSFKGDTQPITSVPRKKIGWN